MHQRETRTVFGLYREGLRQSQMLGIFSLIIINLAAVLLPLYEFLQNREMTPEFREEAIVNDALGGNPLMLLAILMAFLMPLTLFHFLNSRAASDLYHAMPHRRITIYFCYAGSILTWLALMILSSTLVSLVMHTILPHMTLLHDTLLSYGMSIFSMCALLVAGVLVGMSLSGTLFTNVLLSGIVLFAPRFFFWFIRNVLFGSLPFLIAAQSGEESGNLLFALASSMLDGTDATEALMADWDRWLYTLFAAAVYLAIGAFLFYRRRSEAAGQSAPTRLFQHIYRILVTMLYCTVVTTILALDMETYGFVASGDWFEYLVLYLVGVIIYFVYELITTRKWRNLLTALPGLGIVALLNCGVLLGIHGAYQHLVSLRPAASEIESVSIQGGSYMPESYDNYYSYASYVGLGCRDIVITDPTVIALTSYGLEENLSTWEESPVLYYEKYFNEYAGDDVAITGAVESGKLEYYTSMYVTIRTDNQEFERRIWLSSGDAEQMVNCLKENEDYTNAWRTPPTPVDGTLSIYGNGNCDAIPQADVQAIYDSFCEEMKTAPFDELYSQYSQGYGTSITLSYTFHAYGITGIIDCPLSETLTPKAVALYYDALNRYQQESGIIDQVREMLQTNSRDFSLSMSAYRYAPGEDEAVMSMDAFLDNTLDGDRDALAAIGTYLLDTDLSMHESYIDIWLSPYYDQENPEADTDSIVLCIPVDEAIFEDETLLKHPDVYAYYYSDTAEGNVVDSVEES